METGQGRKFWAYVIAQILTTGFAGILAFMMPPEALVTLGQFYIAFETILTGGYIGFNVYQKKVTNGTTCITGSAKSTGTIK